MKIENSAMICRALSDENRLKIVEMLTDGEMCACNLLDELAITQPTLSHHMRVLSECNLVSIRKDGKWCHYSLNCKTLTEFREYINSLTCTCSTDQKGCGCK
jgi:ArsR family transcriptional regulator